MANHETLKRPIADLVADVKAGKLSAVELARASLARIDETRDYHAVLETNPQALRDAEAVDKRIMAGEELPLGGIPFIAKDNFLTFDTHTTAASKILEPYEAIYEGPAIQRLKAAGAILVAKANLDAFAHGSSTENSDFGPTKNPVDPTRVPGGSSGGSAAAVALGQACFALGSDTGGSIRLPASYCGVVGLKPTYGLVPRSGIVAMGSSFDTIGPLTNSVADMETVFNVLAGRDTTDATTIERDSASYVVPKISPKGLKIGVIKEYLGEGLDPEIKSQLIRLVEQYKTAGADVHEISMPLVEKALGAYYILVPAEVSSNLARHDGVRYGYSSLSATNLEETYQLSRQEGFGDEAKRRILIGTYVLSSGYYDAYYKRAQKVRTLLVKEFEAAFEKFDLLIGPTGPTPAFKIGAKADDPLAMYLNDIMTVSINLAGVPSVSLPLGLVNGLPIGVQLIGAQRSERQLFGIAQATEALLAKEGAKA